jgi:hypothetical protein
MRRIYTEVPIYWAGLHQKQLVSAFGPKWIVRTHLIQPSHTSKQSMVIAQFEINHSSAIGSITASLDVGPDDGSLHLRSSEPPLHLLLGNSISSYARTFNV